MDEFFAVSLAAEVVVAVDVVLGATLAGRGGSWVVEWDDELAFEHDGEVEVAEAISDGGSAHCNERVGHGGGECTGDDVSET